MTPLSVLGDVMRLVMWPRALVVSVLVDASVLGEHHASQVLKTSARANIIAKRAAAGCCCSCRTV